MDKDATLVLLGILESGELIETKSKQSRGVVLDTKVIGACNSSKKFRPEFKSRFVHLTFPEYTKEEFYAVVCGFLTTANCPKEIALYIGERVWEEKLGDIRRARAIWDMMTESTNQEAEEVIQFFKKYSNHENSGKPGTKLI